MSRSNRVGYPDHSKHNTVRADVPGCLHFTYDELKDATDGFNMKPLNMGGRKLGEGGFGPVFLGRLKFTEVAIKILRNVPKVGNNYIKYDLFHSSYHVKPTTM